MGVLISGVVFCLPSPESLLVNEPAFVLEECSCLDKKRFFNITKILRSSSTSLSRTASCSPEFHLLNEKN